MTKSNAKAKSYGDGRVSFIAHKEEIRIGIEAGRTLRSLYDEYCDAKIISYAQFTRHCSKYLGQKEKPLAIAKQVEEPSKPVSKPIITKPDFIRRFHHDPTPLPKDQLI